MKILIVTHTVSENDGQGKVNLEVAKGAAMAGHEVHIVAAHVAPEILALPGISWTRVSHGPLPSNLLRYAWFAQASARAVEERRGWADITMANGAVTNAPVDINAVHFVHSGWMASPYYEVGAGLRGMYHRVYSWVNSRLERRAFRNARLIVPVSDQVADEVRAIGVPDEKIAVIPNGVDTEIFTPVGTEAQMPQSGAGRLQALFVGDIVSSRKGLDSILAALDGVPEIDLVVVGRLDGSPYPEIVRASGLEDRVHFLDFRTDVADIMRACDFFVFPSRYEPCGLVVLEAIASGLPVITSRNVGAAKLLDEDCARIFDDPDNVQALRNCLESLASDRKSLVSMGEAAREKALSLTWVDLSRQYLNAFEHVLSAKEEGCV